MTTRKKSTHTKEAADRLCPEVEQIIAKRQEQFGDSRKAVIEEAFTFYASFLAKIGWLKYTPTGLVFADRPGQRVS